MGDSLEDRSEHLVPAERRRRIFELLQARGSIAVAEVEERFGVSTMTARRDLTVLADEGLARRTHGGAVLPETTGWEDSFESRLQQDVADKARLAHEAARDIGPNETVFIDSSTTAHFVLRDLLEARLPVTIVTNSLPAMALVAGADAPQVGLIGLGGELRRLTKSFVGATTVGAIRDFFVDRLVFSVKGIEREGYLTDPDPLEAEVKRAMIERARRVVLLATAQKFDERGLHVISNVNRVHVAYLADPPTGGVEALLGAGVDVRRR